MIRADLVSAVRDELDDAAYDEVAITRASNWFVQEVCNNNHLRRMEANEELTGDTGDTTMEFPDDFKTIITLWLVSPQAYDITNNYTSYGDFMSSYAGFASATPARAREWTDFGNGVRFAAPLDSSHVFNCDYLRKPVDVENDDDEYDWPEGNDELLVKGTLARVMEREEDYDTAAQQRDLMEPLMTAFVKNESRGQIKTGPNVIRTGRGRRTYSAKDF